MTSKSFVFAQTCFVSCIGKRRFAETSVRVPWRPPWTEFLQIAAVAYTLDRVSEAPCRRRQEEVTFTERCAKAFWLDHMLLGSAFLRLTALEGPPMRWVSPWRNPPRQRVIQRLILELLYCVGAAGIERRTHHCLESALPFASPVSSAQDGLLRSELSFRTLGSNNKSFGT